jgi:hypothetical protein
MYSLIDALSRLTGLPDEALGVELAQRAQRYPIPAVEIADWRHRERPRPVWVQRAATHWIGILWQTARATCPPGQCAAVDARYATALDPALGEVYRLLEQFDHTPGPVAPATLRQELEPLTRLLRERIQRQFDLRLPGEDGWNLED